MAENKEPNTDNNIPKKPSLISRAGRWMSARKGYIAVFFSGMGIGVGSTLLVQKYRSNQDSESEEDMTVMEEPSESLLH
jgi:hypothetical protein